MDEQRPRDVAHLGPQRDKHGLAITPGGYLVRAELAADRLPEMTCVPAVGPPGRQPAGSSSSPSSKVQLISRSASSPAASITNEASVSALMRCTRPSLRRP